MIKQFDFENEISFKITKQEYYNALSSVSNVSHLPFLRIIDTFTISQKWISDELVSGISSRRRIRKYVRKTTGTEHEYTSKYYLKDKTRIEINSRLSEKEYNILDKIYKDKKSETKIRSILEDTETGIIYSSDIYEGEDLVTIEVEFADQEERDKFVMPKWI